MKKIAIVLLAAVSLAACKPKKSGPFTVSGKITNLPAQKIMLEQLPFDGNQPVVVDSATLKPDGAYQLKSMAKEEGLFRITFDNGPQVILVNDNDKIEVSLDGKNYRKPKIEGSEATESLYNFFDDYAKKDSVLYTTFMALDSTKKIPGSDSALQILEAKKDAELKVLNGAVKNFIEKSASPAVTYYGIIVGTKSMTPEELKPLVAAASARFKDNAGLAKLKTLLTKQATPQQQDQPYALLNQQAPDLAMQDATGKPVKISSFKGKYVLVDFWASWCGPCRQENPNVVAAYNKYKGKNFTILGVSLDSDKDAWVSAIKQDGLNWNQMSDLKKWESDAVKEFGFDGIPFNVLLDPSGKIIASSLRGEALEKKLGEVLQ